MKNTMFDVHEVMTWIAQRQPVFRHEAHLQSWFEHAVRVLYPDTDVLPESDIEEGRRADANILQSDGREIVIEFKYAPPKVRCTHRKRFYELAGEIVDPALFFEDVRRLEDVVRRVPDVIGYAILLSGTKKGMHDRIVRGYLKQDFGIQQHYPVTWYKFSNITHEHYVRGEPCSTALEYLYVKVKREGP